MLKICVVMFYTKDYKIGSHTEKINREYCKKNNYTLIVYNKIPNELESRHSSWCKHYYLCLLYTSPSPRDLSTSRMPSSA